MVRCTGNFNLFSLSEFAIRHHRCRKTTNRKMGNADGTSARQPGICFAIAVFI